MDIRPVPSLSSFIKGLPKERYNLVLNMRLLDAFPKICVKAEGFKKLRDALNIPQYHKRKKALEVLLTGDVKKRVSRKRKDEFVDRSYIRNNYMLIYSTGGGPVITKYNKKKGEGK